MSYNGALPFNTVFPLLHNSKDEVTSLIAPFDQKIPVGTVGEGEKGGQKTIISAEQIKKGDLILLARDLKIGRWIKVRHCRHHRVEGRLVNIRVEGTSQVGMDATIDLSPTDRVRRLN